MRLMFDVETDGLLDVVSVIHCLWIRDIDTGEEWDFADQPGYRPIAEGLALLERASLLSGHNILTYDLPVLRKLHPHLKLTSNVFDTLIMCRLLWADIEDNDFRMLNAGFPSRLIGKHSLEAWGYRIGVLKGDYGKTTDWKFWSPAMHTYCGQDVNVNTKLFHFIMRKNPSAESIKLEHEFQWVIWQQEQFGFKFDVQKASELYQSLVKRRDEITKELQAVFPAIVEVMKTPEYYLIDGLDTCFPTKGAAQKYARTFKLRGVTFSPGPMKKKYHPFNPGSRDQVAERLTEKYGWVPTKFTETDKPQIDESVLEGLDYPEAKLMNEYLTVEKRIGQIGEGKNAWLKLERNGRIHGRVITNGAVTGRCTHFMPNVAQTPAVKKSKKKGILLGLEGGFGFECRSLFCVDDGNLLVGADASGLELRCLAHFMARYDGGEYGRILLEGDIHEVNRVAAGIDTRDGSKTFIYSYLYGAGDELLGENAGVKPEEIEQFKANEDVWEVAYKKELWKRKKIAKKTGKDMIPPDDFTVARIVKGGMLRSSFEAKTPALAQLKADLTAKVYDPKTRKIIAPIRGLDGRLLRVRSQHAVLNTLLQSAGALLVKKATTILYDMLTERGYVFGRDYANVAHIHDEVQLQVRKDLAEEVGTLAVQAIRLAGEYFKFRIRLDGEFKVGRNWAETH